MDQQNETVRNDVYTHGHHESVLRGHSWRTAQNSAGYLLGHLQPGQDLLDVGCGPGTITTDLADLVAPGRVVGIDPSPDVIATAVANATALSSRPDRRVEFGVGSVYGLEFETATFDVVHAHQVLQHLTDPVAGLVEMRRVLRPGGMLAVRDSDYAMFGWAPRLPMLDRWMELYHQITRRNGAEADAGRLLPNWVRAAGFGDVAITSSTWTFTSEQDRAWWGGQWTDRALHSSYGQQAIEYGLSDRDELEAISQAFRDWSTHADGCFIVVHVEAIARR